jgi:hypothetical protein
MEIHNLYFSPNTVKAIISKGASHRRENKCKDVSWPMKFGVQFAMFYS